MNGSVVGRAVLSRGIRRFTRRSNFRFIYNALIDADGLFSLGLTVTATRWRQIPILRINRQPLTPARSILRITTVHALDMIALPSLCFQPLWRLIGSPCLRLLQSECRDRARIIITHPHPTRVRIRTCACSLVHRRPTRDTARFPTRHSGCSHQHRLTILAFHGKPQARMVILSDRRRHHQHIMMITRPLYLNMITVGAFA